MSNRRPRPMLLLAVLSSLVASVATAAAPAVAATGPQRGGAPTKVLVFPFELIDSSEEGAMYGVRADQTQRLKMITNELVALLEADGRYAPVDAAPIAEEIRRRSPIRNCHCEDELARKVGANVAFVDTVQKVSNLILNINVFVRDVEKHRIVRAMSVDMRGNTDESWRRSLRYLVKNRLLVDQGESK